MSGINHILGQVENGFQHQILVNKLIIMLWNQHFNSPYKGKNSDVNTHSRPHMIQKRKKKALRTRVCRTQYLDHNCVHIYGHMHKYIHRHMHTYIRKVIDLTFNLHPCHLVWKGITTCGYWVFKIWPVCLRNWIFKTKPGTWWKGRKSHQVLL